MVDILPDIEVVEGCKFNCDPKDPEKYCNHCKEMQQKGEMKVITTSTKIVDLPLNITEDRLVGAIDIERILSEGVKSFEPGILAGSVPHSDELHVDERFTLDPETMALTRDYVAEDPVYYADQYVGSAGSRGCRGEREEPASYGHPRLRLGAR